MRVYAGQERKRKRRSGAMIKSRQDIVSFECIARQGTQGQRHENGDNVKRSNMRQINAHVGRTTADDLDQKWQRSANRAEENLSRGPEDLARQCSGEEKGRERAEKRADASVGV